MQSQNHKNIQGYQVETMRNEIPLLYYLQKPEITKDNLTNFTKIASTVQSLQIRMNPFLMSELSISSNEPLMVFTGADSEYSVEGYLNTVTVNLNFNIDPQPKNTTLLQNWIQKRPALIQTTLDDAAKKWFSDLLIEIKSNWK